MLLRDGPTIEPDIIQATLATNRTDAGDARELSVFEKEDGFNYNLNG